MTEQITNYVTPGFRDVYRVDDEAVLGQLEDAVADAKSVCGRNCTIASEGGVVECKPREFAKSELKSAQELTCVINRYMVSTAMRID